MHNTANLLTGESDVAPGTIKVAQGATDVPPDIISYYHPNLTMNLVEDFTQWTPGSVPQPLDKCEFRGLKKRISGCPHFVDGFVLKSTFGMVWGVPLH